MISVISAITAITAVIAVVPIMVAGIVPVTPGLPILCVQARRLLTLEGLQLVGIAALLGNALRGAVVTLLATFELVAEFLVTFGVGIAQLHLTVCLATLPLFKALAGVVALRRDDLHDRLLPTLFELLARRIIPALLPLQFTRKRAFGLLARFRLLLLCSLLRLLLGLLLSLLFALLFALFLAGAAIIIIVCGGILRTRECGGRAADRKHCEEQGNGHGAGGGKAVHAVGLHGVQPICTRCTQ